MIGHQHIAFLDFQMFRNGFDEFLWQLRELYFETPKTWGLFDFHFSRGFPVQPLTKSMTAMASPDSHVHLGIKI